MGRRSLREDRDAVDCRTWRYMLAAPHSSQICHLVHARSSEFENLELVIRQRWCWCGHVLSPNRYVVCFAFEVGLSWAGGYKSAAKKEAKKEEADDDWGPVAPREACRPSQVLLLYMKEVIRFDAVAAGGRLPTEEGMEGTSKMQNAGTQKPGTQRL